ncbi:MAG: helicase-related protein, partial [Dehalococcoidia bacterium]
VATHELWAQVLDQIARHAKAHRTTIVFVNTRRLVERIAHLLSERLGEENVVAHHGSLSRETRFEAEQRLKAGTVQVCVATASLELGIDVGDVDLACLIGSPRNIGVALQRIGRSGHWRGGTPKGRLFPLTRDELVETAALLLAMDQGKLDALSVPPWPLDVMAQQIVAACVTEEWPEEALYGLMRRAHPYRDLPREQFDAVVQMLSEGVANRWGRGSAYLHRDGVNHVLKARRGARLAAITSGGAIPDTADYLVIAEPEGGMVGTVNEDFAVESMAGDVFLLGNTAWKIRRVEAGIVRVEAAHGQAPTIPFWLGEARGRTVELSEEVSLVREGVDERLLAPETAIAWLMEAGVDEEAARQIVEYIAEGKRVLGMVPTAGRLIAERFFDEAGGMQLVVHSLWGSRINRAWGLALRKRFCRAFDFELQAAATDDGINISLGPQHSFPVEEVFRYVKSTTAEEVLLQAVLQSPVFTTRWRWTASRALALLRQAGGKRVPTPIQRMRSDDLLAAVFPAAAACQDNAPMGGDVEPPDHPLVFETLRDCLTEALDLEGLQALLGRIERGEIEVYGKDTVQPSAFSHQLLNAMPYAFLDDAPLEERRARAVTLRRALPEDARELGALDPDAIAEETANAWPPVRDADELHDALLSLGVLSAEDVTRHAEDSSQWKAWAQELAHAGRLRTLRVGERSFWLATEREALVGAAYANTVTSDRLPVRPEPVEGRRDVPPQEGLSSAEQPPSVISGGASPPVISSGAQRSRETPREEPSPGGMRSAVKGVAPVHPSTSSGRTGADASFRASARAGERLLDSGLRRNDEVDVAADAPSQEDAITEIIRGRVESSGPFTVAEMAAATALPDSDVHVALAKLVNEGLVLQGRYRPSLPGEEFCDRRILARIHRATIGRLRREIEPVPVASFTRFLLEWQHVTPGSRVSGEAGLLEVVEQLQGFEAAAAVWEKDLLPSRVKDFSPAMLDALCFSGDLAWGRFARRGNGVLPAAGLSRNGPVSIALRDDVPWLLDAPPDGSPDDEMRFTGAAADVLDYLQANGASFFPDIASGTRRLPSEVEDGLWVLVAAGRVTADGFGALRGLVSGLTKRVQRQSRFARRGRTGASSGRGGSRWALLGNAPSLRPAASDAPSVRPAAVEAPSVRPEVLEGRDRAPNPPSVIPDGVPMAQPEGPFGQVRGLATPVGAQDKLRGGTSPEGPPSLDDVTEARAAQLLRRYGVVTRELLAREPLAAAVGGWRLLVRAYRRAEARGEVRGGRFIAGLVGEQFALPEAVDALRTVHRREPQGGVTRVSACDPLNLAGILTPGPRVPASPGNELIYRDGTPVQADVAEGAGVA